MRTTLAMVTITGILLGASSLTAQDKVVVIPLVKEVPVSTDKLWGKGRPGTKLLEHDTSTGYCTASGGVKFALSYHFATWNDAESVCPKDTWVCRESDLPDSGVCHIIEVSRYSWRECDGSLDNYMAQTQLFGHLADATSNPIYGRLARSSDLGSLYSASSCQQRSVWCCWK